MRVFKKLSILWISAFLWSTFLPQNTKAAVTAPVFNCVKIGVSNASITLNWTAPSDPFNQFLSYEIYSATAINGPYTLLTTINTLGNTSFSIAPVNINQAPFYYYIKTKFNDGTIKKSAPSDTLSTMIITVSNVMQAGTSTGFAAVIWTPLKFNSSIIKYFIYRKLSWAASWQLIDSTNNQVFYSDPFKTCSDSFYYKVAVKDLSCNSVSSFGVAKISDFTPPNQPIVDSITVNQLTGFINLGWNSGMPTGDIGGYIIVKSINGNFQKIDTVFGGTNTFYVDVNSSASLQSEEYRIIAFDTCLSGSTFNTSDADISHESLFVTAKLNQCEQSITLNWTTYKQWAKGIGTHDIYVSEDGKPFTYLTSVGGAVFSFKHTNLNANSNYCYFVRAKETSGFRSSTSNLLCLTLFVPAAPKNHYLNYVTVLKNEIPKLSCFVDPTADILYYLIKRKETISTDTFKIVRRINKSAADFIFYEDSTAVTSEKSYTYVVSAVNTCFKEIVVSNSASTILTKVEQNLELLTNKIQWNQYKGWDSLQSGVETYNIYKSSNGAFDSSPLVELPANQFSYFDDISDEMDSDGKFCYYIEAVEADGNLLNFKETSESNVVCVTTPLRIFVPNAFTPDLDGNNDVFKPVIGYVPLGSYAFYVYDRTGYLLFKTTNPNEGWSGDAGYEMGTYVYVVNINGKRVKSGIVTMIP